MTRAFNAVAGIPWAIYSPALQTILEIAGRLEISAAAVEAWKAHMRPDAVSVRLGRPMVEGSRVMVRDSVAIISIAGPIFPKANVFQMLSTSCCSLDLVAKDFQAALDNDEIKAILLDIDSPGGVALGIHEFAAQVKAGAARKRVVAYVGGMAASAAYWIATGTSEIVVDATAALGSVGVVTAIGVQEEPDQDGNVYHEITSSNAPNKRPDPRTESGKSEIVSVLDAMERVFHADVASSRRVSVAAVIERFGRGGLKIGAEAVTAGMADRTGDFESLLAELAAGQPSQSARPSVATVAPNAAQDPAPKPAATGAAASTETETTMTAPSTTAAPAAAVPAAPAAAAQPTPVPAAPAPAPATADATANAVRAERERVTNIQAHTLPGHEALANTAIAAGTAFSDFLTQQTAAERVLRGQAAAALRADTAASPSPAPAPATGTPAAVDPNAPLEQRCKAQWDADAKLRAEFGGNCNAYLAYEKANAEGRVKIVRGKAAA